MRLALWLVLSIVTCCCTSRSLLTAESNPHQLPLVRGLVAYRRTVVKKGVTFDEFYRAARVWFRDNKLLYALEWEPPIYPTTLLHSALIPVSRIDNDPTDFFTKRDVSYLITIDAKDDSCRILLTNFEVLGSGKYQRRIVLERLTRDSVLCLSVNRECRVVLSSLSSYVSRHAEKPL